MIRHSKSPFAAPIVLVKKEMDWKMCVDYRNHNKANIKDKFPIPGISR